MGGGDFLAGVYGGVVNRIENMVDSMLMVSEGRRDITIGEVGGRRQNNGGRRGLGRSLRLAEG